MPVQKRRNRQDARSTKSEFSCGTGKMPVQKRRNRQDARSTKSEFSCGTGILPVQKRLIEYLINLQSAVIKK
ncbi:MAG: hypothetical protein QQW96_10140 [Tychonema bourrellyi B0820]|nr:hypothetical protein [Tychonema bourrellyi B0820]